MPRVPAARRYATDRFGPPMGEQRGPARHSLAAARPSDQARRELDELLADVRAGEYLRACTILNDHRDASRAPLLRRLATAVTDALQTRLLTGRTSLTALDGLRLNPRREPRLIWDGISRRVLHIWPEGGWLYAAAEVHAGCGRRIDVANARHGNRGDWSLATKHGQRCRRCASRATEFPETGQPPDEPLARELRSVVPAQLETELREYVNDSITDGRLDTDAAYLAFRPRYERALQAAAATVLHQDGEASCMRLIPSYRQLRARSTADLSAHLDLDTWRTLVHQTLEEAALGLPPEALSCGLALANHLDRILPP